MPLNLEKDDHAAGHPSTLHRNVYVMVSNDARLYNAAKKYPKSMFYSMLPPFFTGPTVGDRITREVSDYVYDLVRG